MNDNMFFIDKKNEWEFFAVGVLRKIMGYNNNLMMVKVKFEQDTKVPAHQHPHVQCSLIESGKFEVTIGNSSMLLEKGDGFFVPSNVQHHVKAIEAGIIIDSFNPAREDFIKE